MKQQTNYWKIVGIVFIVLFVLETAFLVYAVKLGNESIEKETECSYDVCAYADAFIYYEDYGICECYVDNQVVLSKYIK